jgi:hypothetical protein
MKKIILGAALLLTSISAMAHPYNMGGYRGGYDWIAPMAIGGFIGYQMNRPQPVVVYQQPQVIYQQQPQIYVYAPGAIIPPGMICETKTDGNYCHY